MPRVLDMLKAHKISQQDASQRLGITTRQVRRLAKRYQAAGLAGLVNKKRGRVSNRCTDEATYAAAIHLIGTHYRDFGSKLACEKLAELHGVRHFISHSIKRANHNFSRLYPEKKWVARDPTYPLPLVTEFKSSPHQRPKGLGFYAAT